MTRNIFWLPGHAGKIGTIQTGYLCSGIAVLLAGIGIYASYRTGDMLLYRWLSKPQFLDALYHPVHDATGNSLASVLVYNVPDGLWFLSGLLLIRGLWLRDARWHRRYYLVFAVTGAVLELSQMSEAIPGVFDIADLLAMGISAFVEGVIYVFFMRRVLYVE